MVGHDDDAPPACGQEALDPLGDEVKLLVQHLRQGMPVVMAECVNSVGLGPADPRGVTRSRLASSRGTERRHRRARCGIPAP